MVENYKERFKKKSQKIKFLIKYKQQLLLLHLKRI